MVFQSPFATEFSWIFQFTGEIGEKGEDGCVLGSFPLENLSVVGNYCVLWMVKNLVVDNAGK